MVTNLSKQIRDSLVEISEESMAPFPVYMIDKEEMLEESKPWFKVNPYFKTTIAIKEETNVKTE